MKKNRFGGLLGQGRKDETDVLNNTEKEIVYRLIDTLFQNKTIQWPVHQFRILSVIADNIFIKQLSDI